jgi:flagellin-specific chaperone FliS
VHVSPIRRRRALRVYRDLAGSAHALGDHPAALTAALLDALSRHLCAARSTIAHSMGVGRSDSLAKACMIVAGLYRTLNLLQAPETTKRLASIYRHLLARINRINRKNGDTVLRELIELVDTLRSAWTVAGRSRSVGTENSPAAVHLAKSELPAQVLALDELNRRHPRALGLLEVVDEQVVAYTHGRKGIPHPVGASDFSV